MRALFVSYNGALESLGQSQVLPYLREIRKDGHDIILLSFERSASQTSEEVRSLRSRLSDCGMQWVWLRYHKCPPVFSTLWDVLCGVVVLIWLTIKHKADTLHARSQVAAAMAWPVSRLLRKRFIFDLRGQMAYEYADGGTWAADGLLFRLVERAERRFIRDADALVVLTRVLASDVAPLTSCPLVIIPTCVDLDLFSQPSTFAPGEPPRMVYCGSLGARYAVHLLTTCFVHARQLLPELELLILTQSDPGPLRRSLEQAGGSASRYAIVQARHEDIPRHLSQALFGVLLLEGGRSLRGACPTKIGEYLAVGLPILSSPGIGDCTDLLEGHRIGVVLKDHCPDSFREGIGRLLHLLKEGPALRDRCLSVAEKEFSLTGVGGPAYRALYRRVEEGA